MGIFNPEADVYFKGHLAQVGGRILAATQIDGGILITADELQIRYRSASLRESGKAGGQFAFTFHGPVDETGVQRGNKFIMIGIFEGTQTLFIGGAQRTIPYLIARCIHVWKTGTYDIADFPYLPDGYTPLMQQTYCLESIR